MESRALIPQIYFAGGKPIDDDKRRDNEAAINEAFSSAPSGLTKTDFQTITRKLFEIPKFFNSLLFDRIK